MTFFEHLSWSLQVMIIATLIHLPWFILEAWVVWVFAGMFFRSRRASRREPTGGQVRREILLSLRSLAIFGIVHGMLAYAFFAHTTKMYVRIDQYGWSWFFLSIGVMLIAHDTYFYWTHRAMHHPWLYARVHRTHHQSISPTPWSAYAFSSGEALIQAAVVPLIAFTIPVHPFAILAFNAVQMGFNVVGHCGHEVFPRWFMESRVAAVLNSVTHHTLHHERFVGNYSLYLNVWDRLLGTNHAEYATRFRAVTASAAPPP